MPFGSKLHFPLSLHNYDFSLFIRKKIKSTILILLSKVHILHVILFVDRNPQAAGLTCLCLLSPRICMSYYNSHRGCPAWGWGSHSRRRVRGRGHEATAPSEVGRRRPSMVLTEALSGEVEASFVLALISPSCTWCWQTFATASGSLQSTVPCKGRASSHRLPLACK